MCSLRIRVRPGLNKHGSYFFQVALAIFVFSGDKLFCMPVMKKKIPWLYLAFVIPVLCAWSFYMFSTNSFYLFMKHYYAVFTMIGGSFVAGSSPEGSAAIAYPIFTLYLKIPPPIARNFAFAIQSIGMTSASLLILSMKIKVEWNYSKYVTFGGIFGLVSGTYYIVPLISPPLQPVQVGLYYTIYRCICLNSSLEKGSRH